MKGANDLTEDLMKHYDQLVKGELDLKKAKQISNLSGKIIHAAKSQLLYNMFMDRKEGIPFFEEKKLLADSNAETTPDNGQ